jgi:hypothetical protein
MTWSAEITEKNFNYIALHSGVTEIIFQCITPDTVTAYHKLYQLSHDFLVLSNVTIQKQCWDIDAWFNSNVLAGPYPTFILKSNHNAVGTARNNRICPCGINSLDCDYHR